MQAHIEDMAEYLAPSWVQLVREYRHKFAKGFKRAIRDCASGGDTGAFSRERCESYREGYARARRCLIDQDIEGYEQRADIAARLIDPR